jgi:hypothetical protein
VISSPPSGLERRREALDERALLARARKRRELASARADDPFETLAGALQRPVQGHFGDAEHLGDLACAEGEHVAQDEHGALARRQSLQPGNEREPDRLPRLVASLGLLQAIGHAFEQDVREGLEPDRLAEASRRRRRGGPAGGACGAGGRRPRARSAFSERFVAIRYSQVRSEERPSKRSCACQAASSVSFTMSSAS